MPDPDTPDNRIISNDYGFDPVAAIVHNSTTVSPRRQPAVGTSDLLKRVVYPPVPPSAPLT